ncbi:DNA invertase Pin-like site-specific DNA recombinase [Georgenia soli]|uniref:DNA invertase Pin-like site-specific DNA recombinase n=1 Tax=Georgenia soli TaxID=638953 RepID=A0A2A9EH41_9MICO|nr:recombinase family protein [Georgenia soli]PFG38218.1 DNA invertase Pin-like site-specific DNA recombinase [Georgenia soli]
MAIYARISQDRGGEAMGVERQLQDCRRVAKQRGWIVAEEYIDNDQSAYNPRKKRPAYERMLADLRDGLRDGVVVYHLDRLHRRPIELERFVEVCERAGMRSLATAHGDVDLGTGDGLLLARLLGIVAANESDAKSRRGKRKMQEIAEAGKPHMGGPRPFGFKSDKVTHEPAEAEVIRTAAERLLAGDTLTSLVRSLEADGVQTVTGKPWSTTALRQMLLSPRNWGMRTRQDGDPVKAVWDPIISARDGERLTQKLTDPARRTNRSARRYLLSGMCRCGRCGAVLVSHPKQGVRKYECRPIANRKGCGRLSITAAPLEEWVTEAVLELLDDPKLTATLTTGGETGDEEAAQLRADLVGLKERRADAAQMFALGDIDRAEWSVIRKTIEPQLRTKEARLATLTNRTAADAYIGHGDRLRSQWQSLNLTRQRAIIQAVINHVTIQPAAVPGRHGLDPERVQPDWAF